jgi:hypothetical protein
MSGMLANQQIREHQNSLISSIKLHEPKMRHKICPMLCCDQMKPDNPCYSLATNAAHQPGLQKQLDVIGLTPPNTSSTHLRYSKLMHTILQCHTCMVACSNHLSAACMAVNTPDRVRRICHTVLCGGTSAAPCCNSQSYVLSKYGGDSRVYKHAKRVWLPRLSALPHGCKLLFKHELHVVLAYITSTPIPSAKSLLNRKVARHFDGRPDDAPAATVRRSRRACPIHMPQRHVTKR